MSLAGTATLTRPTDYIEPLVPAVRQRRQAAFRSETVGSTARTTKGVFTSLGDDFDVTTISGNVETMPADEPNVDSIQPNPDLSRALSRLDFLCTLKGRAIVSDQVKKEATALLRRLADEISDQALPFLGLSEDGTIVMTWAEQPLAGSLSVYGDGTYTYFVKRTDGSGERPASDEASIAEPFKQDLLRLLTS